MVSTLKPLLAAPRCFTSIFPDKNSLYYVNPAYTDLIIASIYGLITFIISIVSNLYFYNSYESGVLEDPAAVPPGGIYKMTRDLASAEDYPTVIDINFEKGLLLVIHRPAELNLHYNNVNSENRTYFSVIQTINHLYLVGVPVSVCIPSGHEKSLLVADPLKLVETLNKLGGQHGVGRIDIVENRFLGLKVKYLNLLKNSVV